MSVSGLQDLNLKRARDNAERSVLEISLTLTRGNILQAAKLLGCSRATVYDLIHRHDPRQAKLRQQREASSD